ncbi:UV-stimulated scaffold protein A [Polymixia lowei]
MELAQRDRLSELVEELTTSGQPQLNQDKMKEVKRICKLSNDYINHVYHSVMSQLNKEHAEIRLSAFQIASELFSRSHQFRTLLVDNFQEFLELTVETDSDQPLPPPKEVSRKLKTLAIKTVQEWQASYGSAYKKLALGYHFLKQVKKVDFHDIQARTLAERRREEERQSRMERIYRERVEVASKEMEESSQEIEATLIEMDSCLKLLLSDEFDFSDLQMSVTGPQNSQPANQQSLPAQAIASSANYDTENLKLANEFALENEQPCCSKDLKEGKNERDKVEKRRKGDEDEEKQTEEKKKPTEEWKEDEHVAETDKEVEVKEKEPQGNIKENKVVRQEEEREENDEGETEMEDALDEDLFIRNSGLISHSYSLDINLDQGLHVRETEENEAVVSTVRDLHRLITSKHLPAVQSWIQVLTKSGMEQQLLRRALDLKTSLEAALQKHKELHIAYKTRMRRVMKTSGDREGEEEEDDDDDDDDFEEVPEKEGFEPHIPEHLREEYGLDPSPSTSTSSTNKKRLPDKRPPPPLPSCSSSSSSSSIPKRQKRILEEEQDPTSAAATLRLLKQRLPPSSSALGSGLGSSGSSGSSSDQRVLEAPVVPFGLDLFYWGQEQPSAGKIIKSASQHQFWVPCEMEEEVENEEMSAESRSRYITFSGSFTPVSHYCSAPLGNGKLCQRQDRVKCPFHGVIVPRDAQGRPTRDQDRKREEQEERRRREEQPDWRDKELMQDIEAATGEDLGSERLYGRGKGKGKGKKKKKYPNLSDLKSSANTSRSRLEKKVFNKSSMRRVTEVMNKVDRRKHDKFSNQFNYALN